MKVPTDLTIPEIEEIRKEGVKALVERLGIAKAAFFLRETASQPLNYLEIKDQLFGEMTATDIYGSSGFCVETKPILIVSSAK
jgi:hypothetical protein